MSYKPLPLRVYFRLIKLVGWTLEKGGIDYNLYNETHGFICAIKVTHGKNSKSNEVTAQSIQKTEREFKRRGWTWPPLKKKK